MLNLGRVRPGSTIYIPLESFAGSTGAPITMSGFATSDIQVYKDGGTTQRASASGFTLLDTDGIDFDGITGIHGFSIDLADNTTADFWASGSKYFVVVSTVTVDSQTMSLLAACFEIGYQGSWLDTTIATLASQTSFTLASGPAEDDALNGMYALIHDAASAVQSARVLIDDYTGSTKTVTLAAGATFTVAAKDNISVMGMAPLQPATSGRKLVVDASGLADANAVKVGPTGSGTAQTAKDLGAINVTNLNTLSGHDPGATLGTSTLTQTQVTGGAYALNSASFAFASALDLTTTQKTSVTTACTASTPTAAGVTGAVGSVTSPVTVGTNNDKTGYRLSDTGVDDIWDEVQSGHATAGSFGLYLDASISGVSTGGVSAGDIADAVWDEARSGHTTSGTFGQGVSNLAALKILPNGSVPTFNRGYLPMQGRQAPWQLAPAATYFVRDTGDDSNLGNSAGEAFRTLDKAIAQIGIDAPANAKIDMAGADSTTGHWILPANTWLAGDGVVTLTYDSNGRVSGGSWSGTAILSSSETGVTRAKISAGDDCWITGIKLVSTASSGQFAALIGYGASDTASKNVTCRDIWVVGDSDCAYFNGSACDGWWKFHNSILDSKWDSTTIIPENATHISEFTDCVIRATGPSAVGSATDTRPVAGLGGYQLFTNCYIVGSGHVSGKLAYGAHARGTAYEEFNQCTISGGDYDIAQADRSVVINRGCILANGTKSGNVTACEDGLDWAKLRNMTTTNALTNTTIGIETGGINAVADAVLGRNASNVEDTAGEHTLCGVILAMMEHSISGTTLTIKKTDGSTTFATKTLTTNAAAEPITGID